MDLNFLMVYTMMMLMRELQLPAILNVRQWPPGTSDQGRVLHACQCECEPMDVEAIPMGGEVHVLEKIGYVHTSCSFSLCSPGLGQCQLGHQTTLLAMLFIRVMPG